MIMNPMGRCYSSHCLAYLPRDCSCLLYAAEAFIANLPRVGLHGNCHLHPFSLVIFKTDDEVRRKEHAYGRDCSLDGGMSRRRYTVSVTVSGRVEFNVPVDT